MAAVAKKQVDLGFQFINVATDIGLVMSGLRRELEVARGASAQRPGHVRARRRPTEGVD
jgi:hypothetical protein